MSDGIRRLREIAAYESEYVRVFDDEVEFPSGVRGRHLRVEPPDPTARGVVLVAESGPRDAVELAVVRTFRYPVGEDQWGFPRGRAQGSDSVATAAAEAEEELGTTIEHASVIGSFTPDSGLLSYRVDVVAARAQRRSTAPHDPDEVAEVVWLPPDEVLARIVDGTLDDGMTMAALLLWRGARARVVGPAASD